MTVFALAYFLHPHSPASGATEATSLQWHQHYLNQQNHCGPQPLRQWQLSHSDQGQEWGRRRCGQWTHSHPQIKWVYSSLSFFISLPLWPLIKLEWGLNNSERTFNLASLHPFPTMCNRLTSIARKATFLEMCAQCHPSLPLGYYSLLTGCTALQHIKQYCAPILLPCKIVRRLSLPLFSWCDMNFIFLGYLNSFSCWKWVIM